MDDSIRLLTRASADDVIEQTVGRFVTFVNRCRLFQKAKKSLLCVQFDCLSLCWCSPQHILYDRTSHYLVLCHATVPQLVGSLIPCGPKTPSHLTAGTRPWARCHSWFPRLCWQSKSCVAVYWRHRPHDGATANTPMAPPPRWRHGQHTDGTTARPARAACGGFRSHVNGKRHKRDAGIAPRALC